MKQKEVSAAPPERYIDCLCHPIAIMVDVGMVGMLYMMGE